MKEQRFKELVMNFSMLADISSFFSQYWIVFVLLGLIIVLYVVSFVRRKKYTEQTQNMLGKLQPGVKVKTYSGFYGKIVSVKETTDGKVILLEMGEGNKVSYTTIDANAVYGVDMKEDVVYDKDGNIIVKEDKQTNKKISADKEKALKEFEKIEDKKPEVKEEKTVLVDKKAEEKKEEPKTVSTEQKEEKKIVKSPKNAKVKKEKKK